MFKFEIPEQIVENKNKLNYKVNFLIESYEAVFPEMKKSEVYKNLNNHFHVFLSERQIQRIVKEKIDFKEEI